MFDFIQSVHKSKNDISIPTSESIFVLGPTFIFNQTDEMFVGFLSHLDSDLGNRAKSFTP